VVVPVRDDVRRLPEALGALARERLEATWEVVVADNGSRDGTPAVALGLSDGLSLRVVDASARRGPWYARNAGAQAAGGTYLVFLDSDDVIDPGYLGRMLDALATADLVAARPDAERLNPGWLARSRPLDAEDGLSRHLGFLPYAPSSCLAVRRTAFEALGGFAPMRACEDVDLCWRAQLRGFTLAPAPGAVLHYRFRHSLRGRLGQAVAYGRAQPLLYRRFRDEGMPRRGVRFALGEWRYALVCAARARSREERAEGVYLAGLALGRVLGSARHRVVYP
jgi:glycosyltransferase involved in cell wall biosynthesis